MLQSNIKRGLIAMLMSLALCSIQSYAASRIRLTTELPIGATITLSISAEGEVSAKGLTGEIHTDGKEYSYTIETQDIVLTGDITHIILSNQQLSQLDIRQAEHLEALYCANNRLKELDLSYATLLQELDCSYNQLERLDIPDQSTLTILKVSGNYIKSLATNHCPELETLDYSDNYYPTSINLSKCTKLQELNVSRNKLQALDLTNNVALHSIICDENEITGLDLAHLSALEHISVANNSSLSALNLGEHPNLVSLDVFATQVSSLDLAKYPLLEVLSCAYCRLSSLDLSHSNKLRELTCGKNGFIGLDVTSCPQLEILSCNDLNIEQIDLSNNPNLRSLKIHYNKLSQIDLSAQKNLKTLMVSNNNLSTLDLSTLSNLEELYCTENLLSSITLSSEAPLNHLEIYDNLIKAPEMADIIAKIPDRTQQTRGTIKVVNTKNESEGNVCTQELVDRAFAKYWRVVDYANFANFGDGIDYRGADAPQVGGGVVKITFDEAMSTPTLVIEMLGELQSSGTTTPIVSANEPLSYTLEGNQLTIRGDIYKLSVSEASIQQIELTNCKYLRTLALHSYQPTTLSLSDLPSLVSLDLSNNQLSQIQLSGTPLLLSLSCYGNNLSIQSGEELISGLPQRIPEELANILWIDSKGDGSHNDFDQQLIKVAHARGWEMSDYLGGDKGTVGVPISFPLSNKPIVMPALESHLQVARSYETLIITTTPHTPIVLYDIMGQICFNTLTDSEGRCDIPIVLLDQELYIITTPTEAIKCAIP